MEGGPAQDRTSSGAGGTITLVQQGMASILSRDTKLSRWEPCERRAGREPKR
jgi:hypothetical protein